MVQGRVYSQTHCNVVQRAGVGAQQSAPLSASYSEWQPWRPLAARLLRVGVLACTCRLQAVLLWVV
jgi:hypothetical protein